MSFRVKVFKGKKEGAIGAQIALAHRLYVSGWWLNSRLHVLARARHQQHNCVVAIGFLDGVPIAVVTIEDQQKAIMAFCRKKYRRHGYGRKTVKAALNASAVVPIGERGVKGSFKFWHKTKLQTKGKPA